MRSKNPDLTRSFGWMALVLSPIVAAMFLIGAIGNPHAVVFVTLGLVTLALGGLAAWLVASTRKQ
ncbi:hypothetical protein [Gryllotalpicola ginsengisoli]|uniref:hypothetical protein n=1 Tax=Gryllotalpicola ginsengisoli TaxID=444608 RepID=UPI0012DC9D9A|nr:hypothetical protein [Gryllotalpicola ginsengisoli]